MRGVRLPGTSRRDAAQHGDARGPILVLASGHRCGSTLVQRLLASHPGVHIWGEHAGALTDVFKAVNTLDWWSRNQAGDSRREFDRHGYRGWMANLTPPDDAFRAAAREFVWTLFGASAPQGTRWWGFKEVRYGGHAALALRGLFADTLVVHVTRDPRDVLRSVTGLAAAGDWDADSIGETLNLWGYVNASLLDLRDEPWVLSVRLEDVVAEPAEFTRRLAAFVGLDADAVDREVFDSPVRWIGRAGRKPREAGPEPDAEHLARLASPQFVELAARYGYELAAVAS